MTPRSGRSDSAPLSLRRRAGQCFPVSWMRWVQRRQATQLRSRPPSQHPIFLLRPCRWLPLYLTAHAPAAGAWALLPTPSQGAAAISLYIAEVFGAAAPPGSEHPARLAVLRRMAPSSSAAHSAQQRHCWLRWLVALARAALTGAAVMGLTRCGGNLMGAGFRSLVPRVSFTLPAAKAGPETRNSTTHVKPHTIAPTQAGHQ